MSIGCCVCLNQTTESLHSTLMRSDQRCVASRAKAQWFASLSMEVSRPDFRPASQAPKMYVLLPAPAQSSRDRMQPVSTILGFGKLAAARSRVSKVQFLSAKGEVEVAPRHQSRTHC